MNDGRDDFFVTFIEVLKDSARYTISGDIAMGDYLHGFLEGLSDALRSKNRQVIRIQIAKLGAAELGMLIALYERAVAMYAEYIHFFIASMMSVFGFQILNQVSGVIGFQYLEALFY